MTARVLALVAVLAHAAAASPASELEQVRHAFQTKDCDSAIRILSALFYPHDQLAQRDDLVEAHAMLGACKADSSLVADAKAQFREVLKLQPDKTLGELLFSATAIRVFDETRRDIDAEQAAQAATRRLNEQAAALEAYRKSLVVFEQHSYLANFIPFGGAQFLQKRPLSGLVFATGQGLTFGVSMGVWLYLVGKYGFVSHSVALTDGPGVRSLQQLEIGAGVAFIGFYVVGAIDAMLHYKARVQVQGDDSLLKDFGKPLPPAKKTTTSLRDRLHFGPIATPSGFGLGLALEND